ncbi:MAG: SMP-30/gluconolactonase/LRE family protein, partial [Proteobacteria bacterium]|nr:SMP-30/gluconolactonase/LRE family protein [Pseudomonadota bacterium]
TDTDVDSDTDTETDTYNDTETFGCDELPSGPVFVQELTGPIAYHALAFDGEGFIVGAGSMGDALFKTAAGSSTASLWVSSIHSVEGMDYLPDGDLVAVSQSQGVVRITPEGTVSTVAASIYDYGVQVTVGPDGMIYVGDNDTLYRIDPDTHAVESLVTGVMARGCDFSPDHARMYVTSHEGSGNIYVAELDGDMNLIGPPTLFATIPGGGPWIDGVYVDECGNLYVPSYSLSELWRITAEGDASMFYSWASNPGLYGHGLKWGSGIGGWDDASIYLPQPYDGNSVVRMRLGVHGRD